MTHPAIALQEAVYAALSNDAALDTLLGGARIYDDVPRGKKPPYVTFGEAVISDWSTGTEQGTEHAFAINAWSRERGRKQVLEIAGAVVAALSEPLQPLDGHVLVNLQHQFTGCGEDADTGYFLAAVNLRAVTEPVT